MDILYCENNFTHDQGEFSPRNKFPAYFISSFSTPFVYEHGTELLDGEPGDFILMPPNTICCQGPINSESAYINDWMCLSGEDFEALLARYPLPIGKTFRTGKPYLLKNCIAAVNEELMLQRIGYQEMISTIITKTIIEMHRLYRQQKYADTPFNRIEAARETFISQLERDWTLQEMADLCDYSPSRFSAIYNERFGCSPKADLINQRIALSKQLLAYTSLSITEIAERCGFGSIYYFSKYFKEREGRSPKAYINSTRKFMDADKR